MEAIIKTDDKKIFQSLVGFLKSIDIEVLPQTGRKTQKPKIDEITILSEKSLAEDWDSEEDQRWDKVL